MNHLKPDHNTAYLLESLLFTLPNIADSRFFFFLSAVAGLSAALVLLLLGVATSASLASSVLAGVAGSTEALAPFVVALVSVGTVVDVAPSTTVGSSTLVASTGASGVSSF
ncbi:hypothetical protein F4778DRAFT_740851 [Xylariomycetidae sp. FL2044]|nr:hypothetical protein F4778DRAFT_740851 [Xylariomycetidae sp. FL2044]